MKKNHIYFNATLLFFISSIFLSTLFFSCSDLDSSSSGVVDPNGMYGSLVIKQNQSRSIDVSSITKATVTVSGYGMTEKTTTVDVTNGAGTCEIDDIPVGKNRVVKITSDSSPSYTIYGYCEIKAYSDDTKNTVIVNWDTSKVGGVLYYLVEKGKDVSKYTDSTITTALSAAGVGSSHASLIDFDVVADNIVNGTTNQALNAGSLSFTGNTSVSAATIIISDPATESVTGVTGSAQTISGITPGTWTFTVKEGSTTLYTDSVTITAGEEKELGTITVKSIITENSKSGVMLQGFTWDSAPRGSGYSNENRSPYWDRWYKVMKNRASDISATFDYLWCPPPSMTDTASSEGYAPTQLNDLTNCYGTETELKEMISAISPTKAIADIVINHRAGTTSWGDFTNPSWTEDYYSICSDDEGFSNSNSPMYGSSKKGNEDSGEGYAAYRDLDHTNTAVQQGIITWMNDVLKPVGFVGWRYDFVKGYGGKYVGLYNKETDADFSVGEYWPSGNYSSSSWGPEIKNWVSATESDGGQRSRAFDFALKGAMNSVFNDSSSYSLLADSSNLYISQPSDAVTFVDNHDTGSTQGHWPVSSDKVGIAYTLILTHPGYPCVAWQHYFTYAESGSNGTDSGAQYLAGNTVGGTEYTLRQHIDNLIELRKDLGIEYDSERTTVASTSAHYVATVTGTNGSVLVEIGTGWSPTSEYSDYEFVYSGTNFAIWKKGGTAKCASPVITISDGKASITCSTEGATILYSTDGKDYSNYRAAFTVTEGTTVYAKATCDGLEESSVVSKTYTAGLSLTVTVPSWVWDDNAVVFAWAWGTSSTGEWITVTGSNTTAAVTVPADTTGFNMARCPAGTTAPDWKATGNSNGRIYNKTANVVIVSGTTSYSTTWEDYNP